MFDPNVKKITDAEKASVHNIVVEKPVKPKQKEVKAVEVKYTPK